MYRIRTGDSSLVVDVQSERPIVYLDTCAVGALANDPDLENRFVHLLHHKNATLAWSWMNIVETTARGAGPARDRLSDFLERIGRRFVLFDSDPWKVIERERAWKSGDCAPAWDPEFIQELFADWTGLSEPTLADTIEWLDSDRGRARALHRNMKSKLRILIDRARELCARQGSARSRYEQLTFTRTGSGSQTSFVLNVLLRETVLTHEQFNDTDGPDFYHAVMACAYCDLVVLDRKWTRRTREAGVESVGVRVFEVAAIAEFLDALASFEARRTSPLTDI